MGVGGEDLDREHPLFEGKLPAEVIRSKQHQHYERSKEVSICE